MRIACVQMEVKGGDKYANMARAERLLLGLKGTDLMILPEVWKLVISLLMCTGRKVRHLMEKR